MSDKRSITEVECYTRVTDTSIRFRWTIDDFSRLVQTVGQSVRSIPFSASEDSQRKWFLVLYPKGYIYCDGFVSLGINCENDGDGVNANFTIALIDDENIQKFKCSRQINVGVKSPKTLTISEFASRDVLSTERVLVDDRLTIECEVSYGTKVVTNNGSVKMLGKDEREELIKDLDQLCNSIKDFDVILEVDGKEFRAHKLILRARSSVFDAMFEHSMKESNDNRVEIEDIGKDVFEAVLKFMYTANIGRKDIDFIELFFAADKYDLNDLKVVCEKEMASKLSVDTVCDVLLLADRHSAPELKERAVQFIKTNRKAVMATKGWKELAKNLDLLNYVIESL